MPPKQASRREIVVSKKMWVSYRLQSMTTERFIKVCNKILQGENGLVKVPGPQGGQ